MLFSRLASRFRLVAAAVVVSGIAGLLAPAASARNMADYGRYLGVRLRLYSEAYEVLDKEIKGGSEAGKMQARVNKAEVMKAQADYEFSLDADTVKRDDLYTRALEVFGEPTEPGPIVARALMRIELARSTRRSDPAKARDYCDTAEKELKKVSEDLDAKRSDPAVFGKHYGDFSRAGFNRCVANYVKALTYDVGSPDRESNLREAERNLDEFQFSLDDATDELVRSYTLLGDIALARGQTEAAVGKYLDAVAYLADVTPNDYVGRMALQQGYLKAVELLTTELSYDEAQLRRVIALYAEAYSRYGTIRGLEYEFKSFQLYRISALIKLGDQALIKDAIDTLFKLAQDRDATFRRQALTVLADIATREGLDNELRFRCATTVYNEYASNSMTVNLKVIQAHQSILGACADVNTFETFGPACFERMGQLYSDMWRFLEATLVYREAAVRTGYFRDKFAEGVALPESMLNRCKLITDGKTAYEFPGKMATLYARHANYLLKADLGEPGNKEYEALASEAETLKAKFGDENALLDKTFGDAGKRYSEKNYAQAAVLYASLKAKYPRMHLAIFNTANIYNILTADQNAPRISSRGTEAERETEAWFADQRARHGGDLAPLPTTLWEGIETAHWDVIQNRETAGQVANWHKAVYYFKKYFLLEVRRAWADVQPALEGKEKPDYVDAYLAACQARANRWTLDNPTGKGEPDKELERMGKAAYFLAYLMRNPPAALSEAERAKLKADFRGDALRLLQPYGTLFTRHLADLKFQQGALKLAFYALCEAQDGEASEAAYRAYEAAFPDDSEELKRMVNNVYSLIIAAYRPRTAAMARAASALRSRSNQLKQGLFVDVKALPNNAPSAEAEKKFNAAKGELERNRIAAEYFWQEWVLNLTFQGEANKDVQTYLADIQPVLQQRWDELSKNAPEMWGDAVKAEFDALLKKDNFKALKPRLEKLAAGCSKFELIDKLKDLKDSTKELSAEELQLASTAHSTVMLNTEALRFFSGTLSIYELAGFLEKVATDVDERARPLTTRILRYYEESRRRQKPDSGTGTGFEDLEANDILTLGKQYFRIRDWKNAAKYLQVYADKYGTVRDYGKEDEIAVDAQAKKAGRSKSGEELEVKYQLGRAYLEVFKESGGLDNLKKSALLMRRCWCFNLIRDANVIDGKRFTLSFQDQIEDYYLAIADSMAEIFQLLHKEGEVKIEWPAYVNQFTRGLAKAPNEPLQEVPKDQAGYLWHATQIHLRVWVSFREFGDYPYRSEFRSNLINWLLLTIRWIETYGKKDMGVESLKGEGWNKMVEDALKTANNESALTSAYQNESTKAYIARLKELGTKLDAVAKKAK
ncbi:MAG: hypothetical protein IT463_09900 [Planctomycetes bacterium]|nr:hypothetical protein [Planctomycetota bacterium]